MTNKYKDYYKAVISNAYYDEKYGNNSQEINGFIHGVCIDFSRKLKTFYENDNTMACIISTLNDDNTLHAAVLYRNEDTLEIVVSDPVEDVRNITGKNIKERKEYIENETLSYKIPLKDYIQKNKPITIYDSNLTKLISSDDEFELKKALYLIYDKMPFECAKKNSNPCNDNPKRKEIPFLADGPCVRVCQELYDKGIYTYCSNFNKNSDGSYMLDVELVFNQLSEENKNIIRSLLRKYPKNIKLTNHTGFYATIENNHNSELEFSDLPVELVIGFEKIKPNKTIDEVETDMVNLVSELKNQTPKKVKFSFKELLDPIKNNK